METAQRWARQAADLQARENWTGAVAAWERAGRQFQLLNQVTNLAVAWHNEAACRLQLRQVDAARELLEKAAGLNDSLGVQDAWWRNQVVLLQLENALSPGGAAARLAQLELRQPGPAPEVQALIDHELARALLASGDRSGALESLGRAGVVFAARGDRRALAAITVTRARVLDDDGRSIEAAAAWEQALAGFEDLGDIRGVAVALAGLGLSLADAGNDLEKATALLERAAGNLRVLGMEEDHRAVMNRLAALHSATGTGTPGPKSR